jgi:hypothetical protein
MDQEGEPQEGGEILGQHGPRQQRPGQHVPGAGPAILHSDQGSEYLSYKHQELCQRMEITLSCSKRASPWQNGFMERWFGNFKLELGNLNRHEDLARFHEAVAMAIFYYNHQRIHLSLKMSPAAYAARLKVQNQQSKSLERVLQEVGEGTRTLDRLDRQLLLAKKSLDLIFGNLSGTRLAGEVPIANMRIVSYASNSDQVSRKYNVVSLFFAGGALLTFSWLFLKLPSGPKDCLLPGNSSTHMGKVL